MKTIKSLSLLMIFGLLFIGCSSDDDNDIPEEINEEEVITNFVVSLIPQGGGGAPITLTSIDIDGEGGAAAETVVVGTFASGVTYNGSMELLNALENPPENIREEVEEEDDEHQFFYNVSGSIGLEFTYTNFDDDNNPLGTEFTVEATGAGNGSVTFTLRHLLDKFADGVANGDITNAGGDTDLMVTFDVEAE